MKITPLETKQNTAIIDFLLTPEEIKLARDLSVNELAKKATIKGFRKGKAPQALVEKQLDPEAIKHETLHHLLNDLVPQAIKDQKLTLVSNPQLQKLDDPADKPWTITISFPLLPVVTLGDYPQKIKAAFSKDKDKVAKLTQDQKIEMVCQILIDNITFDIPQVLIDQEVEKSLSRLLEQTQALGLTIEKYLTSIGKSAQQIKKEYQETALKSLRLEFILLEIAKVKKYTNSESEVADLISSVGDNKTQEFFKKPEQRSYLESILLKRKVIDELITI
ncbi:MAG: hypothetical protein ACD_50C00331G0002 [uncultured bacterium]|nr:MAG: hypothetical protein ACD_50C00331G0002 [uncultured bacterium]